MKVVWSDDAVMALVDLEMKLARRYTERDLVMIGSPSASSTSTRSARASRSSLRDGSVWRRWITKTRSRSQLAARRARGSPRQVAASHLEARLRRAAVMRPNAASSRMTFSEYLRAEAASDTKHEFLDGEVYAMAGGTPEHARIAANVIRELGGLLAGGDCREYTPRACAFACARPD